jgi:catechol 2,3-dioxygenase-like lactoylglutathione lyase family enzyme
MILRPFVSLSAVLLCLAGIAEGQPPRPKIKGIAHVRVYVSDVARSSDFYTDVLALPSRGGGCENSRPCLPVNPRQQIEFEKLPSPPPENWLAEIAFATDDVAEMRSYLLAHGLKPGAISKDANGARHFEMRDPEGNPIAFTRRPPTVADIQGNAEQVGRHLFHVGWVVHDLAMEKKFYCDLLGFRLYWYGGFKDADTDWYEIQVPDGDNWVEFMLNIPASADHHELGIQNHFSLGVVNIKRAYDLLVAHGLKVTEDKPANGHSTSTIRTALASNSWSSLRRKSRAAIRTPLRIRNDDYSPYSPDWF